MKRITAILAILATMGLGASPALAGNKFTPVASAGQPVCPLSTGAANASLTAVNTGNAPLICAASPAS